MMKEWTPQILNEAFDVYDMGNAPNYQLVKVEMALSQVKD